MTAAYIGLDIGGQSIKGLRLEADGRVSRRAARPTPSSGAAAVLAVMDEVLADLDAHVGADLDAHGGADLGGGTIAAVGAGTPGGVDPSGRIAGEAANVRGWAGTDLRSAITRATGAPAFVRNDGNMAAYAEWAARGGSASAAGARGSRALLFVGLGTGIGGGYIEEGRIIGGVDDKAAEIGHVIVYPGGRPCACGRSGCVEAYASGPSIGRIAFEMAGSFDTPLARAARTGGAVRTAGAARASAVAAIDAREVYAAFAAGDELAEAVHAIAAEALARAVGQALALLAPDTVVLGGGVLAGATTFVADVARLAPKHVYAAASSEVRFEAALLGPEAGLYGAALYAASSVLGPKDLLALAGRAVARSRLDAMRS